MEKQTFKVVVNHEEQYAIWFCNRNNPSGWQNAGFEGTQNACLDHIESVWTCGRSTGASMPRS